MQMFSQKIPSGSGKEADFVVFAIILETMAMLILELVQFYNSKTLQSGPEVIKLFSYSTQLSIKFLMLISIKISRNLAFFRLR